MVRDRGRDTPGFGDIADLGQSLPALRARCLGKAWREKVARGDRIIVRYADDAVLGFQYREEAERFLEQLRERLRKFGLELHPDKTRLIEFGRYAAGDGSSVGKGNRKLSTSWVSLASVDGATRPVTSLCTERRWASEWRRS